MEKQQAIGPAKNSTARTPKADRKEPKGGRPKKSPRNKTIDFSLEEGKRYFQRCLTLTEPATVEQVKNRTIVGDMFQVCPLLPNKVADLIIVDPPYNLSREYHGNPFHKKSHQEYLNFTHRWLGVVAPLLKDNGSVYVCSDWETSLLIAPLLMEHFTIKNRITWQREKGRGAKTNWKNSMEDLWFGVNNPNDYTFQVDKVKMRRQVMAPYRSQGQPKDWEETTKGNFRDTYPSNFWDDITIPFWSMAENTAHPTQKPEKLMAKLILASSRLGDIVLDPFSGAGTAPVTAKKLGRHFISIEQNPRYCAWAEKRLEMADTDPTIQGYTDGVFWERNTGAYQNR